MKSRKLDKFKLEKVHFINFFFFFRIFELIKFLCLESSVQFLYISYLIQRFEFRCIKIVV